MSDLSLSLEEENRAGLGDYFELLKPRVMRLVVFTGFAGLVLAPDPMHPFLAFVAILSIALGAGASGALNMVVDADIDALMERTKARPIPSGRVRREDALAIGIFGSLLSVAMLGLYANWLAAGLLAFTIIFYAGFYSLYLKRRTAQNIVIGGVAGALPPVIGWAAASGGVGAESLLMFLVIFLWTPPHFWALALFRNDDYRRAGIPMLPVIAGARHTIWQIRIYTILFSFAAIGAAISAIGGFFTWAVALGGGVIMIKSAYSLEDDALAPHGTDDFAPHRRYFARSIWYLFAFFLALLADNALGALHLAVPGFGG